MTSPRVADLTVGEFRELCRDTFAQVVEEVLDDPDRRIVVHIVGHRREIYKSSRHG